MLAIAFLAGLLSAGAPQAAPACAPLVVRNLQGNYIVPGVRGDIPYSGDRVLDAYVQPGGARRSSVVVIHGGGWTTGSRIAHVGQLLELLTHNGFHWFSLDYRLGGLARVDDSLADIRAALTFIRCHAGELGIDPDRLILLGEDSGAHLAALLAAERPTGVIGAALIGGFYDLTAVPGGDAPSLAGASPMAGALSKLPPVMVVHGGADSEVPPAHARRYCDAVVRANGRCEFLEVTGASHRSENWWPVQWTYKPALASWLASLAPSAPVAPAAATGSLLQKDIVFSPTTGLKLDAFVPRSASPTPAVILVHGGGWEAGDKVTYITPLFEPLARAGFAWFSIDYRLTPAVTNQEQIADVREAIAFVRAQHARFNIDPARIVLVGESASGQIVTQLATSDSSLAGVISFYGVYDFPSMVTDASPRSLLVRLFRRTTLDDEGKAVLRQYSPLYHAHKGMPPLLLVNGTGERLWSQAQAFARRLSDVGARHTVIALEGAPHGMENWEGHPKWMSYKRGVVLWIREQTRQRQRR